MWSRVNVVCARHLNTVRPLGLQIILRRSKRYEAFDSGLDKDALKEARTWYEQFDESKLPKGNTTFARSSGAGGQHVNKTESKAITAYPVKELMSILPKSLHSALRTSRFYTANNDSLTFHAQENRVRAMNMEANTKKLVEEIRRIFKDNTPAETSQEKKAKHKEIAARFHDSRLNSKKAHSSKKQSRRGFVE